MNHHDPPFFIVGCGRSGTSLLRGVLNEHPELAIPLESLFIADYLRVADRIPLAKLKRLLLSEPELREWGIEVSPDQLEDCDSIADVIARVHKIYAQTRSKSRWGQKTPRLVRHHNLLRIHFPEARFVHMVRDPRAVVSSLVRSDVHRSTVWHASKRWIRDVEAGLELERQFADGVQRVRYEDLVTDPEAELQRILRFLQADPMIATPEQSAAKVEYSRFYANIHSNLSREISADYTEQWKHHLTDAEVDQVASLVGSLPQQLGYAISSDIVSQSSAPSMSITLQRIRGLAFQIWRYLRYRPRYIYGLIRRKWKLGLIREFISELNY